MQLLVMQVIILIFKIAVIKQFGPQFKK